MTKKIYWYIIENKRCDQNVEFKFLSATDLFADVSFGL